MAIRRRGGKNHDKQCCPTAQDESRCPPAKGYLPLTVILEILSQEYKDGVQGEVLCRTALRLAEESGVLEDYRARWDAAEEDPSNHRSALLYDRRQSLELISYYRTRGYREAAKKESDILKQIEGRLLLDRAAPAKITAEDIDKLEGFLKESGF